MSAPGTIYSRIASRLILWILVLGLFACSRAEDRAAELYSTAEFEEQQFNPEHASELYRDILQKFPDTSWADKASLRLETLGRKQTIQERNIEQKTRDQRRP